MEGTLRAWMVAYSFELVDCLNPCFNGRYSQSQIGSRGYSAQIGVLILVLMEDTLRTQNLRILEFRGFNNSKTYKIGFC